MLISTHIIDSVDMMWDRTVIMQNGKVKANVTRAEIDGQGKSLEDLFFEVTEGVDKDAVTESESTAEKTEAEDAAPKSNSVDAADASGEEQA